MTTSPHRTSQTENDENVNNGSRYNTNRKSQEDTKSSKTCFSTTPMTKIQAALPEPLSTQSQSQPPEVDVATRVRNYNNSGALCLRCRLVRPGWELLKGALELELASQRQRKSTRSRSGSSRPTASSTKPLSSHTVGTTTTTTATTTHSFTSRAEAHHRNMGALLQRAAERATSMENSFSTTTTSAPPWTPPAEAPLLSQSPLGRSLVNPSHGNNSNNNNTQNSLLTFEPFLYSKPFLIQEYQDSRQGSHSSTTTKSSSAYDMWTDRTVGSTLIFNLAWVEQSLQRSSPQAIHLYQMAASLLCLVEQPSPQRRNNSSSSSSLLKALPKKTQPALSVLSMALLNNMGVWLYENGDIFGAQLCMEHLSRSVLALQLYQAQTKRRRQQQQQGKDESTAPPSAVGAAVLSSPWKAARLLAHQQQQALIQVAATLDPFDLKRFQNNVRWILHPPTSHTSPAA
eukprot:CAMPEP_0168734250 /NCGR_PEP_ID=MMETSP0724-20121128/8713_1 /TAXON_ID=265536 /ORGANISM="Amphiprora sp., Strain CCMP467" /LENGTH=456 /DNA_ID=CAMNT_0008781341 /DNA_START=205 /DNA_END=1575 /DNA_ORIENTATION=+